MLSMKFPHLFLRPEIIITFLWGLEWSGGQVRHRSPWNSGFELGKDKGGERKGMGSAFYQLCPRYSGTLTPTACPYVY